MPSIPPIISALWKRTFERLLLKDETAARFQYTVLNCWQFKVQIGFVRVGFKWELRVYTKLIEMYWSYWTIEMLKQTELCVKSLSLSLFKIKTKKARTIIFQSLGSIMQWHIHHLGYLSKCMTDCKNTKNQTGFSPAYRKLLEPSDGCIPVYALIFQCKGQVSGRCLPTLWHE